MTPPFYLMLLYTFLYFQIIFIVLYNSLYFLFNFILFYTFCQLTPTINEVNEPKMILFISLNIRHLFSTQRTKGERNLEKLKRFINDNRKHLIRAEVRKCMDGTTCLFLETCPEGWDSCGDFVSLDVSNVREGRKLLKELKKEFPDISIIQR